MNLLATNIEKSLENSSWIRQMFERGIELKKQYGAENVYDFSLGNPDLPPSPRVAKTLEKLAKEMDKPFALGYMPNAGYPKAREALAAYLSKEQQVSLRQEHVVLSCGAAGALNSFFKSVLNPLDEVLCFAPYFVEYGAYVSNHGGEFRTIQSKGESFSLDLEALASTITKKTRAVLINSPNNPTGQVYSEEELKQLAELLTERSKFFGRPIFLIADEPYRYIVFDNTYIPPVLPLYPYTVLVSSFSKSLSIPGERIGYIAISPEMEGGEKLINALTLCNRILGFVNPPAIGQQLMIDSLGAPIDITSYKERRSAMAEILTQAGYEFLMPKGTFYFFPKAPGGDDVEFCQRLMKEMILAVPGSGFGGPGYFRLALCVDKEYIYRASEGFKKAIASY